MSGIHKALALSLSKGERAFQYLVVGGSIMLPTTRLLLLASLAVVLALAVPLPARSQPAVTPNSAYAPGVIAITVQGGGSAADVTATVERDSGLRVQALWMLFAGSWRYYLPATPQIDGGLTLFPQTGAAYVVLGPRDTPQVRTVTLADNGSTVELVVGQRLRVDLGRSFIWRTEVDDPRILEPLPQIAIFPPPPAEFLARARGETTVRATGDPPCRHASPPCLASEAPSILFQVRVVVR